MSPMSRRDFLAASAVMAGAGLAAGCEPRPVDNKSVLVIGAGMAGLAAARSLADAGRPVRIIEARNRIGGRIDTNREWGTALEMGASWIHGTTNNPLLELADKVHAQIVPTDYNHPVKLAIDPPLQPITFDAKAWRDLVSDAREEAVGGSLGAAVAAQADRDELSDRERAELAYYVTTEIEDEYAADADQLSVSTFDQGSYTGGPQSVVTSGYDAFPHSLADGLQIIFNAVVNSVAQQGDSITVRAGDRIFHGPAAIITVPLGVLKSGAITFDPPLPEAHAHAVTALGFGVLSKSYFRFRQRNWDQENAFYQYLGAAENRWAQWFTLPAAAGPIVLAFNPGRTGRYVESAPPADLLAGAAPIAQQLFGADLVDVRSSRWTVDPYALGSYSYHAPGSGPEDRRRLQEPVSDRIYLAGEAVGSDNPATVHGALLSGRHAAAELLRRLG
ncbi:FAD-dependent oxidoreductase [Mycobacterium asiaticum]|uniref:Monoamine oxidase n=1 Tax=Mycobacterium asiaticum TaxID=1790 RepID=A0A1A3NC73_MYCAS|nr:FAD-dependent oxidoreductase [Mycobacterium asiaticum]OBK19733.1 monoamine oxidase [Mycobacterium asiaticum]